MLKEMSNNALISTTASKIGKEAGLIIFGAASGMLLSGLFGDRSRKPIGLILGVVGIAAAGPELSKLANKMINNPATDRGSKKTLEGIRYGAGKPVESIYNYGDEDSIEKYSV